MSKKRMFLILIVTLLIVFIISSCEKKTTEPVVPDGTVATPAFNPVEGMYNTAQNVTLSCSTPEAIIRYTTNGNEPTESTAQYSSPISVSSTTTIKARAYRSGWTPSPVASATYTISGVAPSQMVYVEGGSFQMGNKDGCDNEKPVHTVTLSSFYIDKYELTQKEWVEVMGRNPSKWKGDNLPVEYVDWLEVIDYCNKRSVLEDLTPCYSIDGDTKPTDWDSGTIVCNWTANGYRLPTETEWEYAARGGNQSKGYTYSGSNYPGDVGWYSSNAGYRTHPVGMKQPNELGIYDMSGNVWEWCWDWYDSYPSGPQNNPKGPESGSDRVIRGGYYHSYTTTTTTVTPALCGAVNPTASRVATMIWASAWSGFSLD